MWGSAIEGLVSEGAFGGALAPAEDESRPGVGRLVVVLLVLAVVVGLALLPVLVGIGILMGRTVTLGLAFGFGVTVLAGFKLLALGFGVAGGVLSRPIGTSAE